MKLLVLLENTFNDIELTTTLSIFKASNKFDEITFYSSYANKSVGQFNITTVDSIINEVNVNDYDAIFIPGGSGCQTLRTNKDNLNTIKQFIDAQKRVFAICDAPNVLAETKILPDVKYSSYPSEWSILTRTEKRTDNDVTVDQQFITARNAVSAEQFGFTILKELFGKDHANAVYQAISGNIDKTIF
ncbi:DJ-1/PfpI family protein [Mycoplasma sp. Pen4]|uniref:DJ-1/PfpI family protein n=1 Tax=Mycoplasma sp. Pen4 TaxID=640330 RepID=UPI00165470EA|nr:DJ-1/PfpI family protein [Mycoplasma sp. Pen4]QNM93663.1 DJ-1/PfpI family protein [Mycoplasma sp. Pen4]